MKFHADSNSVEIRHVNSGILPCLNYKSEKGSVYGDKCHFRHVEAEGKPRKRSKKGGAKGSVAMLKESTHLGCASQDSVPRKSILREPGRLGSKHAVKFFEGTLEQIKIRERKGPSKAIIQKCEPHERSPCAPKFEEKSYEETLTHEQCARKAAWDLAKKLQAQVFGQSYVWYSW